MGTCNRRKYPLIIILIFLCLTGFFCKKESRHREKIDKRISIGIAAEPLNWLTIIAVEKKIFEQYGLNVSAKDYPSGKRALLGMFKGEVDIATTSEVPVVFNSFDRSDFSIFSTIGCIITQIPLQLFSDVMNQKNWIITVFYLLLMAILSPIPWLLSFLDRFDHKHEFILGYSVLIKKTERT